MASHAIRLGLLLCLLGSGLTAEAKDPVDRWQVTTQVDLGGLNLPAMPAMSNMPPNIPPGTMRMPQMQPHMQEVCTSRGADAAPVADHDGRCKVSDVRREGNRQTLHMDCGPNTFSGNLELVYDTPDHYRGRMEIASGRSNLGAYAGRGSIVMTMEGRRVGVCEAGSVEQTAQLRPAEQPACMQSAVAAEFEAFLGAQPRCKDTTAVQTFCKAVQDFDGFLNTASHELETIAPAASGAVSTAITHPLTLASQLCGFKIAEVRLDLCVRAEAAGKFAFLLGQCATQSVSLAQRICTSVGIANAPAGVADFCSKQAAQAESIQARAAAEKAAAEKALRE